MESPPVLTSLNLICPYINPVLVKIGPLSLGWYGIMYTLGATAWYIVTRREIIRTGLMPMMLLPELCFNGLVCGVIGARLWYVIIYNAPHFMDHPWEIFAFWQGGMSAYGWLVGMAVGGLVFLRDHNISVRRLADVVYLGLPLGLMAVKIGNFLNCEGFGRTTSLPWGVTVVNEVSRTRHPVQLYEALLEGLLMYVFLNIMKTRSLKPGDLSCFFLIWFGLSRFFLDFLRDPSPADGAIIGFVSDAQLMALVVIAFGLAGYILERIHGRQTV